MKFMTRFNPKLYELLEGYTKERFIKDFGAGLTVSVVALPLAMAFAIASGLKPEAGIFTAIIAGFLISLFSGSRVQIGGPAGAFIVIVYGIVQEYGVEGLLLATLMSGAILWIMGFLRMGLLIQFIPVAVIIGFTNGIAVLIGLSQVDEALGLQIEGSVPADFFSLLSVLWEALPTWNPAALALCLGSLALIVIWQQVMTNKPQVTGEIRAVSRVQTGLLLIPGSIVALVAGTLVSYYMHLDVATIGSKFGGIPRDLPEFTIPAYSLQTIMSLFFPAVTLAILGAIESLLCARVADSMIRDRHDSNQELLSQGFANMVVPFFGGMPATGTIARTVTNIKNGGNSPVSGMVHAFGLLVVVLVAAPLAQYIPLSVLSAVLLFVAWNMGEWREFLRLKNYRLPYRITLLAVFLLTVVIDLTVAVQVGIVFSCFIFIFRISNLSSGEAISLSEEIDMEGVQAYRLSGALFFGAVQFIEQLQDKPAQHALILDFSSVIYIDSSGYEALKKLLETYQENNIPLIVCGLRQQPMETLSRAGWLKRLGEDDCFQDLKAAENHVKTLKGAQAASH